MDMNEYDIVNDKSDYPNFDEIDFSQITRLFGQLVLFDNVFLNMQGMNIAVIDQYATGCEYDLLREYFQTERTPLESAIFVSALSQMWIFTVYELLRTWRQQIKKLQSLKTEQAIDKELKRIDESTHNHGVSIRRRHLENLQTDPTFRFLLGAHDKAMEPAFRFVEAIRMNLAKHEVKGDSSVILRAPGYGRINMQCGAMDFEIGADSKSYQIMNRRDVAEALRNVNIEARERKKA